MSKLFFFLFLRKKAKEAQEKARKVNTDSCQTPEYSQYGNLAEFMFSFSRLNAD